MKDQAGRDAYYVYHIVLSCEHCGLPQHRERVFIVAIRQNRLVNQLAWPSDVNMRSLQSVLQLPQSDPAPRQKRLSNVNTKNIAEVIKRFDARGCLADLVSGDYVVDIGGTKPTVMEGKSPCLTKRRCEDREYFSIKGGRRLTMDDMTRPSICI
jgi:site-specific DNA-cytosine methylase